MFPNLPGTNRAADRFARASFLLSAIPKHTDPNYIKGVPQQSYAYQAVASVLSVQRAVSVPLGITTPDQPNISSTIWRTVSDQKNLVYYFDSATRPNTFWVTLAKLNLERGAPVKKPRSRTVKFSQRRYPISLLMPNRLPSFRPQTKALVPYSTILEPQTLGDSQRSR